MAQLLTLKTPKCGPVIDPTAYTGCLVGLGTFPVGLVGLGTHFNYKFTIMGQNTYFCSVFNEFGVCVLLVSYLNALILHTFQDFELAVFKPFFIKMFKVFLLKCLFL